MHRSQFLLLSPIGPFSTTINRSTDLSLCFCNFLGRPWSVSTAHSVPIKKLPTSPLKRHDVIESLICYVTFDVFIIGLLSYFVNAPGTKLSTCYGTSKSLRSSSDPSMVHWGRKNGTLERRKGRSGSICWGRAADGWLQGGIRETKENHLGVKLCGFVLSSQMNGCATPICKAINQTVSDFSKV